EHLGVPLKNAWKVVNTVRSHYFLFYTRTAEEKLEWMRAFGRERAQVRQDLEQGIVFTEREKEDARRAALATRTNTKFNKKPKGMTAEEKLEWMRAFGRERAQVRQDLEQGIVFTEREKEDARRAALATRTNSKFNKKPKGKPSKVKLDPDVMASFMRQMNPASYSAAGSTTTTTNN
ncbi:unnamed protein product, partial [Notodromas monacha]